MDGKVTDLKDFAAECARGFGAFVHLRDSTGPTLTYPEKPSEDSSYATWLRESEAEQARWEALDEDARRREWEKYRAEKLKSLRESLESHAVTRARYLDMLAQVQSVNVPEELDNFKQFMIDQLNQSIEFDCGKDDSSSLSYHQPMPFDEWVAWNNEHLPDRIERYRDQLADEQRRYEERVEYINLMRDTFGFNVEEVK
jgi:hypothetical protein